VKKETKVHLVHLETKVILVRLECLETKVRKVRKVLKEKEAPLVYLETKVRKVRKEFKVRKVNVVLQGLLDQLVNLALSEDKVLLAQLVQEVHPALLEKEVHLVECLLNKKQSLRSF
jgi:hypothetical protein